MLFLMLLVVALFMLFVLPIPCTMNAFDCLSTRSKMSSFAYFQFKNKIMREFNMNININWPSNKDNWYKLLRE